MATAEARIIPRRGGRPVGSGARTVRIQEPRVYPNSQEGGRLYIGRPLWQEIGSPERVDLVRPTGGHLGIRPGTDYAVGGRTSNGQPRLSLGQATLEEIGLDEGTYEAHVASDGRTIVVSGTQTSVLH